MAHTALEPALCTRLGHLLRGVDGGVSTARRPSSTVIITGGWRGMSTRIGEDSIVNEAMAQVGEKKRKRK